MNKLLFILIILALFLAIASASPKKKKAYKYSGFDDILDIDEESGASSSRSKKKKDTKKKKSKFLFDDDEETSSDKKKKLGKNKTPKKTSHSDENAKEEFESFSDEDFMSKEMEKEKKREKKQKEKQRKQEEQERKNKEQEEKKKEQEEQKKKQEEKEREEKLKAAAAKHKSIFDEDDESDLFTQNKPAQQNSNTDQEQKTENYDIPSHVSHNVEHTPQQIQIVGYDHSSNTVPQHQTYPQVQYDDEYSFSQGEGGWDNLEGLDKVEEMEKQEENDFKVNHITTEENPDLQLEREEHELKDNTRFKFFKFTEQQEKRAKELIEMGFEMLNMSTIYQVGFQLNPEKEFSELWLFKLDEESLRENKRRSSFAHLNDVISQHFTNATFSSEENSYKFKKNKCFDDLTMTISIEGEFSRINLHIRNPKPSCNSSIILEEHEGFYVIPLNFKKELAVTIAFQTPKELELLKTKGYNVIFLDDNRFVEVLSSYWVIT